MSKIPKDLAKTAKKRLVKDCDGLSRKRVFLRAAGRCQRCGSGKALQWCHYFGRRLWSVRWDMRNVWAFCSGCHRYFDTTDHPAFTDWLIAKIGQEEYDRLRWKRHSSFKRDLANLELKREDLKRKLENEIS